MGEFLRSARRKVARAKVHFDDLVARQKQFLDENPYAAFTERDPDHSDRFTKFLRLVKPFDITFEDVLADAAFNLRAALDHACYAVAVAAGKNEPKSAHFPISKKDATGLDEVIRQNCRDIPWQIHDFLRRLKPYPGGNEFIVALNALCNTQKHAFVAPSAGIAAVGQFTGVGTGFFSVPDPHCWDMAKNQMELITFTDDAKQKYNFSFTCFIAFAEVDGISGEPVLAVLDQIIGEIERVLGGIEAEAIRLGFFKE